MSSMYEMVVSCITKPSTERTAEEINNIAPWLRMKAGLFDSLKPEVLNEIIKNCTFSERKRDDIIIRQGDKGDCFYVMLAGRVSIFINTEAVPDNPEDATVVVAEDKFKEEGKTKKELDRNKYGKFIAVLDSGKAFGELALINEDCIRNASIIADEMTHLLIVNRDLYNRSMKEIQTQEFNQRLSFVNNSSLFNNWLSKYKRQVAFSLRKEKYGFNMNLVTQGEPTNGLTFILSGHAKVVINANQHTLQYPWLNVTNNNEEMKLSDVNDLDKSVDFEMKKPFQNSLAKRLPYIEAEHRQAQRNIEVCIVKGGEIIGDMEQGLELTTYASSVITIEPTEVYILDAKNFERLCNAKRNFKTLNLLKKKAIYKIKYRGKRLEQRPIPFYTRLNDMITDEEEKKTKESDLKNQKMESLKNSDKFDNNFFQHRGPLIDLYGPGSVFYRNRQLRKEKQITERKRQITEMALKGRRGNHHGITNTMIYDNEKLDNSDDDDSLIVEEINTMNNYNNYINNNSNVDLNQLKVLSDSEALHDWETGSAHLQNLESRLQNWFLSVGSLTNDKRSSARAMEYYTVLKRFRHEDTDKKIIPGKKIFLRPKKQAPKKQIQLIDDNRNEVFITATKLKTMPTSTKKTPEDNVDSILEIQNSNILPNESIVFENNHNSQRKSKSEVQRNILSHQYTKEEYKKLKLLLKKKEIDMRVFQTAMSI